jgi:hypothetical protein
MSEFVLDYGTPEAALRVTRAGPFVQGYVEALFFTNASCPDDGELEHATVADLAPSTLDEIISDCARFQEIAESFLKQAYARGYEPEQAGRDFWFTRNGHGVGFWDRAVLKDDGLGDSLSALCGWQARNGLGELDVYMGDDGKVYLS